ncbi:MAG: DUF3465 domain-containing protein [Phycisphaerales bacterium]|nr:DUF3465 domain-containing protein [Phycisphaerales bacterium]
MPFSTGRRYTIEDDSRMIEDAGQVLRILSDDTIGSRHQRFIVRLSTGQTILIVHNIDLVKRVPVAIFDRVRFKGEYEFGPKGGLVHWTHQCPRGEHEAGWIEHEGVVYT